MILIVLSQKNILTQYFINLKIKKV